MTFIFPAIHSFPPFYTLQPNTTTREAQLRHWSKLIQSYCRHYRLFKLSISDQLDSELFSHRTLRKSLNAADVRRVLEFMRDEEHAAQPMTTAGGGGGSGSSTAGNNGVWWIWWRKPEEWANLLEVWVRFSSFYLLATFLLPSSLSLSSQPAMGMTYV